MHHNISQNKHVITIPSIRSLLNVNTCMHNVLMYKIIYNDELSVCLQNTRGITSMVQTEDMDTIGIASLLNALAY